MLYIYMCVCVCVCVCITDSLCSTAEAKNIIYQLYSNKFFKKTLNKIFIYTSPVVVHPYLQFCILNST